jgi:hypothetical protein
MKTNLFIILLASLCMGCRHQDRQGPSTDACQEAAFALEFENCLMLISQYHSMTAIVHSGHMRRAVVCLEALTGVESHQYLGDVVGYTSDENGDGNYYYEMDLRNWNGWREKHPRYTLDSAKISFERYGAKHGHNVDWPKKLAEILKE